MQLVIFSTHQTTCYTNWFKHSHNFDYAGPPHRLTWLAPVVRWERRKGIVSVDITFLARGVRAFSYARYELANVTVIFDQPNVLTEHSYSKQDFTIFIINENKTNPPSWCLGNQKMGTLSLRVFQTRRMGNLSLRVFWGVNHISLPVFQAEESHDTRFGQYQRSMGLNLQGSFPWLEVFTLWPAEM